MGCDYYIVTVMIIEYIEEINGNIINKQYWDTLSNSPRYICDYDEYVYTLNEAFEMQINEQLKFKTDVVYYENEQWVINCIQSKFNKYFEKFGNNITKIYKTSYASKRKN